MAEPRRADRLEVQDPGALAVEAGEWRAAKRAHPALERLLRPAADAAARARPATGRSRNASASATRPATAVRLSLAPGTIGLRAMSANAAVEPALSAAPEGEQPRRAPRGRRGRRAPGRPRPATTRQRGVDPLERARGSARRTACWPLGSKIAPVGAASWWASTTSVRAPRRVAGLGHDVRRRPRSLASARRKRRGPLEMSSAIAARGRAERRRGAPGAGERRAPPAARPRRPSARAPARTPRRPAPRRRAPCTQRAQPRGDPLRGLALARPSTAGARSARAPRSWRRGPPWSTRSIGCAVTAAGYRGPTAGPRRAGRVARRVPFLRLQEILHRPGSALVGWRPRRTARDGGRGTHRGQAGRRGES